LVPPARHRLIAAALILVGLTAACAPTVQRFGPAIQPPVLGADTVVTADGARLPLRVWHARDPKAVIVALHGFNDYSRAFAWPAAHWARNGIATYAYDQRGFGATAHPGLWPGDDTLVRDAAEVLALVRARHPGVPIYLLGESMGGAVALATMAATDPPPGVRGLILVAPAVWGWARLNLFYETALWVGAHTIPWKTFTGKHLGVLACDNMIALRQLGRDPLFIKKTRTDSIYGLVGLMDRGFFAASRVRVPTLVLYGDNDEVVPEKPVLDMVGRLVAPHRFLRYRNGYHMLLRDQEGPLLWRDIRDWIADPAAPMYGADRGSPAPLTRSAGS
jgi:alpha-beta hydrolase superfamily lysophospholipase